MTTLRLKAQPPFRLESVVYSHGWVQLLPFTYDQEAGALSYITHLDVERVTELALTAEAEDVRAHVPDGLSPEELIEIENQVRWMLALDQDFSTFYLQAKEEPALAHIVAQARGRILRSATLFEDVVKMILTTNTSWGGTKRMVRGLVEGFGTRLVQDPARRAFPTPRQLAEPGPDALRQAGLGYRGPFVADLARDVAEGRVDLESLKASDLSTDELRERLLAIKGIGAYASAGLLMLLGRYDAVPVDSYAKQMVSNTWHDGAPVTAADVEAAFNAWGEWQGLAYWFWDWSQAK